MSSFLRERAEMALYNILYGSLWGIWDLEFICELMSHWSSLKCWQNYSKVSKEWYKHKKKVRKFFAISPIWTELCLRGLGSLMIIKSRLSRQHATFRKTGLRKTVISLFCLFKHRRKTKTFLSPFQFSCIMEKSSFRSMNERNCSSVSWVPASHESLVTYMLSLVIS